jgi:3-dehydroquinate synthase
MARINVTSPDGAYPIVIQRGLLSQYAATSTGRSVVITNETIVPLHGETFAAALGVPLLSAPDGELYKNLDTVRDLYVQMIEAGADRKTTVIALGGGVIGDMAGFVAATYMRGVDLVQVPTSLLAMVDSSVGGKVGVDVPQGKNLIGAFKQPEIVLIDPDVLGTLPDEEWRNGMAEVVKHGLIADPALLDPVLWARDHAEKLVTRAVQVKVDVVQRDPFEQGERMHLNLGHTFAHAIEQVTQYAVPHGAAVGVGLLAAAKLSHRLGMCDVALVERVDSILQAVGLPRQTDGLDPAALLAAMRTDKKWKDGISRFVLLHDVGRPAVIEDVDNESVLAVLEEMR